METCYFCLGAGVVESGANGPVSEQCPICNGTGQIETTK